MNDLHAEKRPDKHGNVVTRWVRSFGKNTAVRIPAPALVLRKKTPAMEAEIKELCGMLQPPEIKQWSELLENNVSFVAEQDHDLLKKITKSAQFNSHENVYWNSMLGLGKPFRDQSREEQRYLLSEMRMVFVLVPLMDRIAAQGGDAGDSTSTYRPFLENIVRNYMSSGQIIDPPESLVSAVVMVAYIRGLHDSKDRGLGYTGFLDYQSSKKDAEYIAAHTEIVEAMLLELRERRASDREMIEQLLNSAAPSLRDGML